ncbi:long-chain fatty alcohol dehydrogenase [Cercophora newfieldiana]|uniref:Long-chain-alcohol oxidase n=1 Tax=Cercophora newfieldiana TaxID=92897 RepID=A0AA40CPK4_9PEZI|nr:long-chain fatty alcohol dehydrogenase [Cercophora newfieldiana]
MAAIGPTPPPLPPAPTGDFFDATQWAVITAILDAVIPSITAASTATDATAHTHRGIDDELLESATARVRSTMVCPPSPDLLKSLLEERPSANPAMVSALRHTLNAIPESSRRTLGSALTALSTRPGSFLLTGSTTPLHEQSLAEREAVIQRWSKSWFGTPRLLFKTFTTLGKINWVQNSELLAQATGFPAVPVNWKLPEDIFEFEFMKWERGDEPVVVETDVVIVGSGCGGGVVAKVLAEAGHRVLVVEKGYHFDASQLPMSQAAGSFHMFESNGVLSSVDGSLNLVAGSTWGGGGSINWSVSLQTQGFVRKEWAEEHGLPFFETAEYQASLDRVCEFMGVVEGEKVRQTHRGRMLLEGSRRLGWPAAVCPQNSGGGEHWCGHCHLGCGSGEKQGPAVCWLPAAAAKGAKFVEGLAVDGIVWDEKLTANGENKAVGIRGTWTSRDAAGGVIGPDEERIKRQVVVKAKKVIVSAGSLNSPLVLMKSGLTNPHIGRNLHVHPVNFLAGVYEEDTRPWEGGIITSVCTNFENLDGKGHGAKLESTMSVPFGLLSGFPWRSGLDYKLNALRLRHMAVYISLARDRDTGRVFPDSITGKPVVDYRISPFDNAHVLEGLVGLAKICYVTGAKEIHAYVPGLEPFVRPERSSNAGEGALDLGITDPNFVAWLAKLKATGSSVPDAPFTTAHQMGSCRMSSHSGAGVVDSKGKVWGTEGLYVADASVFPSASGVNPMVTVMAIADWIARGIAEELKSE